MKLDAGVRSLPVSCTQRKCRQKVMWKVFAMCAARMPRDRRGWPTTPQISHLRLCYVRGTSESIEQYGEFILDACVYVMKDRPGQFRGVSYAYFTHGLQYLL